jgi:hypothetical protein
MVLGNIARPEKFDRNRQKAIKAFIFNTLMVGILFQSQLEIGQALAPFRG